MLEKYKVSIGTNLFAVICVRSLLSSRRMSLLFATSLLAIPRVEIRVVRLLNRGNRVDVSRREILQFLYSVARFILFYFILSYHPSWGIGHGNEPYSCEEKRYGSGINGCRALSNVQYNICVVSSVDN